MSKSIFHNKIAFSFLCALILPVAALAQNADLQTELSGSFAKFKLARLDNQAAPRKASSRQPLTISTGDKNYELNLTPRDLRARRYRAEETTAGGVRAIETSAAVTTFKGTIMGENESQVRLTIDGTKIEGYFFTRNEKFYIEPARNYSRLATAEDFIVYVNQY